MSYLIDQSFFVADINIPNPNGKTLEKINLFIKKYEPECLERLLGYRLHKVLGTETSQRMTDLRDGKEYTDYQGNLKYWEGLKDLVAYYVYHYYIQFNATNTTGTGEQVTEQEGGKAVYPVDKTLKSWNTFSKKAQSCIYFLWNNKTIYTEVDDTHLAAAQHSLRPNNFLGI